MDLRSSMIVGSSRKCMVYGVRITKHHADIFDYSRDEFKEIHDTLYSK